MGGSRLKIQSGVRERAQRNMLRKRRLIVHLIPRVVDGARRDEMYSWFIKGPPPISGNADMFFVAPRQDLDTLLHMLLCTPSATNYKEKKGKKERLKKRIIKKKECSVSSRGSWAGRGERGRELKLPRQQDKLNTQSGPEEPTAWRSVWSHRWRKAQVWMLAPSGVYDSLIYSLNSSIFALIVFVDLIIAAMIFQWFLLIGTFVNERYF